MQFAGSEIVAVGAASAQSAVIPANIHKVMLTSTTACYVNYGANPTASAATGSFYLPANEKLFLTASPGTKFAVIQAAAGGNLSIAYLS